MKQQQSQHHDQRGIMSNPSNCVSCCFATDLAPIRMGFNPIETRLPGGIGATPWCGVSRPFCLGPLRLESFGLNKMERACT